MAIIRRVWIEEGCLPACSCELICPQVFQFPDADTPVAVSTSRIRGSAQVDGVTSRNETERVELYGEIGIAFAEQIIEAAKCCPVEVIKFEIW